MGDRRYVPALDGIRALAVVGVLLFHFGVAGVNGGLLGVDVFFVLSGFLITSLLVEEWVATGTLSFARFYARRARRLLPALFLLIALVAVYAAWFAQPDTRASIRGDALSTLGYFANWHFVFSDQGYFVHFGPPSPLLHTWSLAVEEQFYLIWPGVAWLVLRHFGRRGLAVTAAVALVASAVVTVLLFHAGAGSSSLYYGTEIRTQEVMAGAFLAIVGPAITRWHTALPGRPRRWRRAVLGLAGLSGLAGLVWMFHAVSGEGDFLYNGGFLVVAVATAGVVAVAVHQPENAVARVLALGPIRYVGRISYGLYLYHYPLFLMLDPEHTGLGGWELLAVRLAATFAVSVASFHLVELPIRNRRRIPGRQLLMALPAALGIVVVGLVVSTTWPTTPSTESSAATLTRPSLLAVPKAPPAGLTGSHRVRVLLFGDSIAETLGWGLGKDTSAWGVSFTNYGFIGCDLDWTDTVNFQDNTTNPAQGCKNWPVNWKRDVDRLNPDVVALELGRWEVSNRLLDGQWSTVGQAPWDRRYSSLLAQAIRTVSSRGAHVVLFTLPYIAQTTDAPNGQPWDINQPSRTNAYNALTRRVASTFPRGVVTVIDLNKMVDPQGHYTSYLDGIRMRNQDNEHISVLGGMLLRPVILPQLVELGLAHAEERGRSGVR